MLLLEKFKPDEEFVFGPQSMLDQNQIIFHSQESLSFDGVCHLLTTFMLFLSG